MSVYSSWCPLKYLVGYTGHSDTRSIVCCSAININICLHWSFLDDHCERPFNIWWIGRGGVFSLSIFWIQRKGSQTLHGYRSTSFHYLALCSGVAFKGNFKQFILLWYCGINKSRWQALQTGNLLLTAGCRQRPCWHVVCSAADGRAGRRVNV